MIADRVRSREFSDACVPGVAAFGGGRAETFAEVFDESVTVICVMNLTLL